MANVIELNPVSEMPEAVTAVFTHFLTCEFTTLNRDGRPLSWPVMPLFWPERGQIILFTSIGLPQKAFNARRDPRVSVLFSDPTGSGLENLPVVLVQGDAAVSDEIMASFQTLEPELSALVRRQALQMLVRQPSMKLYISSPLSRRLMDWYFMRLMITVTPRHIRQLEPPVGDHPEIGRAPAQGAAPVWRQMARHAGAFASAVLIFVDGDGYPFSLRCHPRLDHAAQRVRLALPDSVTAVPGPACLLWHRHDERLGKLRSFVVRGALARDADGWFVHPETFVPGVGVGGWLSYVRFVVNGRRTTCRYLQKRGLPRPRLDWQEWEAITADL